MATTNTCSTDTCGTGGWAGPLPGDPGEVYGLTATPAFGGIQLNWNLPGVNPQAVAYVTIFRSYLPDFQYAVKRVDWKGSQYFDQTTAGEPLSVKYYWIQVRSVNGTLGQVIGPASATARPMIDDYIELLTNKIDKSILAQELQSDIDNIGVLGQSITEEVQDRLDAINALGSVVGGLQGQLEDALVIVEEVVEKQVTDTNALVQSMDLLAIGLDNRIAGVVDEKLAEIGDNTALAQRVTTVEATVNGDTATGQVGLVAKVDGNTNTILSMWTAKLNVNGLIGGFGLANNGQEVDAGFDVDTFWVGRTTNKKKPFIISNGEVIIDRAVLGQVTADNIDTRGLTLRAQDGQAVVFAGTNLANSQFNIPGTVNNVPGEWLNANLVPSINSAAQTANWNQVASRPLNLSELDSARASKLDGVQAGATVGAPSGTFVGGIAAESVASATTNFNLSNDRNGTAVAAPTVATNGTAIDHTIQSNASADISFEWSWSGNEGDIDGFQVYVYQAASSSSYTFGSDQANELVFELPAAKRAFILYGMHPTTYYSFAVLAYRKVDKDIAATGVIKSTLVKATGAGENPYQPANLVAFAGNVTGTVNGISAADVNVWASISGAGKPQSNATVGAPAGTLVAGDFPGGRSASVVEQTAVNAEFGAAAANSQLPSKLNKAGDTITGRINLAVQDGLFTGTDLNNGVYMGTNGLVGKKAGQTTFSIGTDGTVMVLGDIYATSFTGQVVNTQHIIGGAASTPYTAQSAQASISLTVDVPAGASAILLSYYLGPPWMSTTSVLIYSEGNGKNGGGTFENVTTPIQVSPSVFSLTIDGQATQSVIISPTEGSHTITLTRVNYLAGSLWRLSALVMKR